MKKLLPVLVIALLTGCAASYQPIPEGYAGPKANISDSFNTISGSKVEFFYVEEIDEHRIENSRFATLAANQGRGMYMSPVLTQRAVPAAKSTTLKLVARTEYAAPILAMTNAVYQVKGNFDFTPEPGKRYIVRGELSEDRSTVWLEDEETKQLIGKKIETQGSAKLGFFEK